MPKLTVTAKGQVTLRKELLQHLGVLPGDQLIVDMRPDGKVEMQAAQPVGRISDIFDLFKRRNRPTLSVEQIGDIAKRGWAGRR
jgi:bifunctional DNA-binding transcriptional regulator/antitoxin component of YhaV-PrlF toxin-antitoxin module